MRQAMNSSWHVTVRDGWRTGGVAIISIYLVPDISCSGAAHISLLPARMEAVLGYHVLMIDLAVHCSAARSLISATCALAASDADSGRHNLIDLALKRLA